MHCLQEESTNFGGKNFELNQVVLCPKMFSYYQVIYYQRPQREFLSFPTLSVKIRSVSFFILSSDMH